MKICPICNQEKEFYKNKSKYDGLSSYCKECTKNKRKEDKEKQAGYAKTSREKTKSIIDSHKKPCVCCGESDPVVIDFHHVDPATKSFGLGGTRINNREKLENEIAKCVCLCANCHRRVHAGTIDIPRPRPAAS